jgi:hypothetical protein
MRNGRACGGRSGPLPTGRRFAALLSERRDGGDDRLLPAGARREHQFDRTAQGIDERMDFGRQSAAGSADRLFAVFFRAPALC